MVLVACGGDDGGPEGSVVTFVNALDEEVTLNVEFAITPQEKANGLANRESLPEDSGMMFLYAEDHQGGFYMKDTTIPVSIAFIQADGTIVDIQDMEPLTEDFHRPEVPYRHAIEANQGWFVNNFITAGLVADLPSERIDELLASAAGDQTDSE